MHTLSRQIAAILIVILGSSFLANAQEYRSGVVLFKVKPVHHQLCKVDIVQDKHVQQVLSAHKTHSLRKVFPRHQHVDDVNRWGNKLVDISTIYEVSFGPGVRVDKLMDDLNRCEIIAYADRRPVYKTAYTPNDSIHGQQYYLTRIDALNAWNISRGDSSITIGIVDTGWDTDHKDLMGNVQVNRQEPINGVDDDGDGYIDNRYGWDITMNDNDAGTTALHHGVWVTGVAAAQADNTSGIAGTGFDCRFLPVKVADDGQGLLIFPYEGIVYAADHGAQVINCSWGGFGGGPFGQDIVNYATINRNALVVGAAGNNANDKRFFPAAYENVLSVINTDQNDSLYFSSSYGNWVDIAAPGADLLTTFDQGTYSMTSGTSIAAPVVSGCAGIVGFHFPGYNAGQIGARLKATADNINASNDPSLLGKLGAGRVNLFQALNATSLKWAELCRHSITDGNDGDLNPSDSIFLTGYWCNYLDPVGSMTATITVLSTDATVLDGTSTLAAANTLDTVNNAGDPFVLKLVPGVGENIALPLEITLTDGINVWKNYLYLRVNRDYIHIHPNNITTTLTSHSRIGYRDDNRANGVGFKYKFGYSDMYEGGLMLCDTNGIVADNLTGDSGADIDFASWVRVKNTTPQVAAFEYKGIFNDFHLPSRLNVDVEHFTHAYTTPADSNYIIQVFKIHNIGSTTLEGVHAGFFMDWDIFNSAMNRAGTDVGNQLGYACNFDSTYFWYGVKLLSGGNFRHYAFDIVGGGLGGIDISDGFSSSEKHNALRISRNAAGSLIQGNDVASLVSTGPYTIAANDTVIVAFALIAGDTITDLQASAVSAQTRYNADALGVHNVSRETRIDLFPNPFSDVFTLKSSVDLNRLTVVSLTGEIVKEVDLPSNTKSFQVNVEQLAAGTYLLKVEDVHGVSMHRVIKMERP